MNTSPGLLASLGGASDDVTQDVLRRTWPQETACTRQPGFDITQITGLFYLEPNDRVR